MLSVNVDLSAVSVVGFQSTTYTVNEGDEFDLVIELQDNITQPLMINVHTEDDSAVSTSDGDYDPKEQTLTFQPGGVSTLNMTVQTRADNLSEPVESFRVVLTQPSLGLMISEGSATVTIIDNSEGMGIQYEK